MVQKSHEQHLYELLKMGEPATVRVEQGRAAKVTPMALFRHPATHPIVLDVLLLNKYGPEWLEWEAETLEIRVPQDFNTPTISDINLSKLNAAKTLHLVDSFWQRWEVFVWCTMPFNSIFPDFEVMQVPSVIQCMFAVEVANKIRTDVPWSDEMKAYLEGVCLNDGIICPQEPLDFVSVDSEDYPIECSEVTERWPDVRASGKEPSGDSPEDEQLRRLLGFHEYLVYQRSQLEEQMKILAHV